MGGSVAVISPADSAGSNAKTIGSTNWMSRRRTANSPHSKRGRRPPSPLLLQPFAADVAAEEVGQGLRPAVAIDAGQGGGALGQEPPFAQDLVAVIDADGRHTIDVGAN